MSLRPRSALCAAVLLTALPTLCGAVLVGSARSALRSGVLPSQQAAALLQTSSRGGESEQVQEESEDMLEESEEESDDAQVVMSAAISDEAFNRLSKHKESHWEVLQDFMNKTFADIGFITNISPRLSYDAPHGKVGGPFIEFRFPKAGCAWPKYRPRPKPKQPPAAAAQGGAVPSGPSKDEVRAAKSAVNQAGVALTEAERRRDEAERRRDEAQDDLSTAESEKEAASQDTQTPEAQARLDRATRADDTVQEFRKQLEFYQKESLKAQTWQGSAYPEETLENNIEFFKAKLKDAVKAVYAKDDLYIRLDRAVQEVKAAKQELNNRIADVEALTDEYEDKTEEYKRKKEEYKIIYQEYKKQKPPAVAMYATHTPAPPLSLPRLPLSPNVSASPRSPLSPSAKAKGLKSWCDVDWGSCAAKTKVMAVLGYKWNAGYAIYVPIDTKALESEVGIGGWFPTIPGTKEKASTRSKWMVGFWHQHILGIDGVKGPMTLIFGKDKSQYDKKSKEWYPLKSDSPEIELMWRHTGKFQLGKPSSEQKNWANTHLFFFTESAESPDGRRMFFELNGTPDFSGKGNHEIGMETRSVVKNIWTDWLADKCGKKGADGWPKF